MDAPDFYKGKMKQQVKEIHTKDVLAKAFEFLKKKAQLTLVKEQVAMKRK